MSNYLKILTFFGAAWLSLTSGARAELDPELATASTAAANDSGLVAGGFLSMGSGLSAGNTRPGPIVLGGGEIGYSMARDSWNRFVASFALSGGSLSFKRGYGDGYEDRQLNISLMPMIRGGFGKSISHRSFWVWRVGMGAFLGNTSGDFEEQSFKSSGVFGLAGQLGADVIFSVNDWIDVQVGYQLNHLSFEIEEAKNKSGDAIDGLSESYNVNAHMLSIGAGLHL